MTRMTDDEVMAALKADTPLNRARAAFSSHAAGMEQSALQRTPPGPIEARRMEFEAVEAIAKALGVTADVPLVDYFRDVVEPADRLKARGQ